MEKEDDRLGVNIYRDGLKIYTTLDSRIQHVAEESLIKVIKQNQDKLNNRLFNNEGENFLSYIEQPLLTKDIELELIFGSSYQTNPITKDVLLKLIGCDQELADKLRRGYCKDDKDTMKILDKV